MRERALPAVIRTLLVALLVLALPALADGQTLSTSVVAGEIRDANGDPLSEVAITVTHRSTGAESVIRTSRAGRFVSGFLAPGTYDLLIERLGYQPERLEGVVLTPGVRTQLDYTLELSGATVDSVTVRRSAAFSAGPLQRWVIDQGALPLAADNLEALIELSSRGEHERLIEGLPGQAHTLIVDGLPRTPRPDPLSRVAEATAIPISSLGFADLLTVGMDAAWPGAAGAYLTGLTRPGTRTGRPQLYGDWSGDALGSSGSPFQSYRLGGQLGGTGAGDSAQYLIGFEYERRETPLASLWMESPALPALEAAVPAPGLAAWTEPTASRTDRIGGYGRADFRISDDHLIGASGRFSSLPEVDVVMPRTGERLTPGTANEGMEVAASTSLSSTVGDFSANEVTLGFEMARMERSTLTADLLPRTDIASIGRSFGAANAVDARTELRQFYLHETFLFESAGHRFKLGGWVGARHWDIDHSTDRNARFAFGSPEDLAARTGAFRIAEGVPRSAQFDVLNYAIFAHDTWAATPGLQLSVGVRLGLYKFPDTTTIRVNADWGRASGRGNNDLPRLKRHVEPRFGFEWRPANQPEWLLRGGVSVDGEGTWPETLAEVISNDGALVVREAVGDLGAWPGLPSANTARPVGPTLTLLGPEFTGPLSTHVFGGIRRSIGAFSVDVSGSFRQTDFLPARRDLNLLPLAAAHDQHGRPLYGTLTKVGGLLAAEPGTNRRIPSFAEVYGIEAIGSSRYTGVTVTLERAFADGLALHGSYTYSRTEDDWLWGYGMHPDEQISPFPELLDGVDWADGRSDFDIPHRVVVGAEIALPVPTSPRIAALYRRQSGYPFTPGYPDGVDANADGSGYNDPAFIDPGVSGTDALVAEWSCLSDQVGGFAERNACRGPTQQALDARLIVDLFSGERYGAQLVLDGLDLLGTESGRVNRAVYLVDPTGSLDVSPDGRLVTVPLVANDNFGELVTRYAPQRQFRLGMRVSF